MKIHQTILTTAISLAIMGAGTTAFAKDPEQMPPQQQQQQMQQVPPPPMQEQQQQVQQVPPMQQHMHGKMEQRHDRDHYGQDRHDRWDHHARFVRVHRGDTLSRIANRYHTTVYRLKRLNHLHGNTIYVGQGLRVR